MEKVNLRFVSMIYFWKNHEPDSVVIANGTAKIIKKQLLNYPKSTS
jgi:hypothetical protein